MISTLITLLIVLLVIGLIFWLLQRFPIAEPFKSIIICVAVIIAIVYLAQRFL